MIREKEMDAEEEVFRLNRFYKYFEQGKSITLTEIENKLLEDNHDFCLYTKKCSSDGSFPLMHVLANSSYEFIETVLKKVKKTQSIRLLELGMHLKFQHERPKKLIEIVTTQYGYKLNEKIANHLLHSFLLHGFLDVEVTPNVVDSAKDIIRYLESLGGKLNVIPSHFKYYYTPLEKCFFYGEFEIAKMLIELGADVNLKNNAGATPLMLMCGKPPGGNLTINETDTRLKIIELLLIHGANPNFQLTATQNPVYWAKRTKRLETLNVLNKYISKLAAN